MKAKSIISRASELVSGERAQQHGPKDENHANIASLWSAYLDTEITPAQVALMLALLKIARTKAGSHNLDNYVDLAGYAGIAGELATEAEQEVTHVKYGRASEPGGDGWVPHHGLVRSHHCAPEENRDFVVFEFQGVPTLRNGRADSSNGRAHDLPELPTDD